jgi:hypothetical protein
MLRPLNNTFLVSVQYIHLFLSFSVSWGREFIVAFLYTCFFIRLFLSSCAKWYDIRETDLFQPSMLYDYSDFAQVSWNLLCDSYSVEFFFQMSEVTSMLRI